MTERKNRSKQKRAATFKGTAREVRKDKKVTEHQQEFLAEYVGNTRRVAYPVEDFQIEWNDGSRSLRNEMLQELVGAGYMEEVAPNDYFITDKAIEDYENYSED